jgi:hypothetical protein
MRLVNRSGGCRVLSLVPVAVVVGAPGLYLGDRWQRQLRGSSQRSYVEREVWRRCGQHKAVQLVVDVGTAMGSWVESAMISVLVAVRGRA